MRGHRLGGLHLRGQQLPVSRPGTRGAVADALPTKPTLPLDKRHVQIELWLSADMKFLLMVLGFKSANGKHSCIFCTADLKQRQDWLDSSSSHRLRSEKDEVSSPVVVTPILTATIYFKFKIIQLISDTYIT